MRRSPSRVNFSRSANCRSERGRRILRGHRDVSQRGAGEEICRRKTRHVSARKRFPQCALVAVFLQSNAQTTPSAISTAWTSSVVPTRRILTTSTYSEVFQVFQDFVGYDGEESKHGYKIFGGLNIRSLHEDEESETISRRRRRRDSPQVAFSLDTHPLRFDGTFLMRLEIVQARSRAK